MSLPGRTDYIDIHTHYGTKASAGTFSVISLMAHEEIFPESTPGIAFTFGIHPWFLTPTNHDRQLKDLKRIARNSAVIAIGEAGFDKIKGPDNDLQRRTFEEQVAVAEAMNKPLVIHCVRAWDELLKAHKRLKPSRHWLVHGFRGNKDLAGQLVSKNMFLSFWFDFVNRPEATPLIRSLPVERIFLETDGSGVDIKDIYKKVSEDLEMEIEELKGITYRNFKVFFSLESY
ncbi:MAG TPA: hypothetical protein DDW27_16515 [Bacteroidales bacterium]|nr:hypothetical protein [Bacteroidales bacterium]